MFSNPLLLSRRRCYRHLHLLPGCRCRLLCPLAGFRCRRLHPRLLPGFLLRRLHRFCPLPCCRCRRLHQRLLPACCLRDHLRLFPGFCLRRLHPLPACRCRLHPRPLPSCRRRCLRLLAAFVAMQLLCILQARQRTNVRPLCPGSEKQTRTICRAKSKPFRFSNNGQQCSCKEVTLIVGDTLLPGITYEQT